MNDSDVSPFHMNKNTDSAKFKGIKHTVYRCCDGKAAHWASSGAPTVQVSGGRRVVEEGAYSEN